MKDPDLTSINMNEIYKQIGKNVKRIREKKGYSQLKLSLSLGHKAVGTVSNAELCLQNKHFNIEHLVKISTILDVPITDFFEDI